MLCCCKVRGDMFDRYFLRRYRAAYQQGQVATEDEVQIERDLHRTGVLPNDSGLIDALRRVLLAVAAKW